MLTCNWCAWGLTFAWAARALNKAAQHELDDATLQVFHKVVLLIDLASLRKEGGLTEIETIAERVAAGLDSVTELFCSTKWGFAFFDSSKGDLTGTQERLKKNVTPEGAPVLLDHCCHLTVLPEPFLPLAVYIVR